MSPFHGQFCWCELMAKDAKAATDFYTKVIGWTAADSGLPGIDYTILSAGEARGIGGIMACPDASMPAGWTGYIMVDDTDAMVAKIVAAGGAVHNGPADIPQVGRFAIVGDPEGAGFALLSPLPMDAPPPQPAPGTPGTVGWHELMAGDRDTAFGFYEAMFGWKKKDAIDLGPMGIYQLFATRDDAIGGMMTCPPGMPRRGWTYYFNVDGIDEAIARATAAGGMLLHGPVEVPGGSWIAHCADPQSVVFAMVSAQKQARG